MVKWPNELSVFLTFKYKIGLILYIVNPDFGSLIFNTEFHSNIITNFVFIPILQPQVLINIGLIHIFYADFYLFSKSYVSKS